MISFSTVGRLGTECVAIGRLFLDFGSEAGGGKSESLSLSEMTRTLVRWLFPYIRFGGGESSKRSARHLCLVIYTFSRTTVFSYQSRNEPVVRAVNTRCCFFGAVLTVSEGRFCPARNDDLARHWVSAE